MITHRRLTIFFCLFAVFLFALAGRLAYIQLYCGEQFEQAAVKQQRIRLDGIDSRGIIYDRSGLPLTGSHREYVYIIRKDLMDDRALRLLKQADTARLSGYSDTYSIFGTESYHASPTEILKDKYEAYVLEVNRRYQSGQIAAHIIGYVNPLDEKGVCGIELMCDPILSQQKTKTYAHANARGEIIRGYGVTSVSANETSHVTTTLDAGLQHFCESRLIDAPYDGAVIVLESATGQLLAAASTPTFNPNTPAAYTESENSELFNKAIQGEYPPGSIFKIVVAAAALEYNVTDAQGETVTLDTNFFCSGQEDLYGINIGCKTGGKSGHGNISLRNAMAQSCNCAFVQLGSMVGGERILQMARLLGLGENPYPGLAEAATGNLTSPENTMWAGIGNLSIGQGELLITPLQGARMLNIIANNGRDVGVELILDNNNEFAFRKGKLNAKMILSSRTAELLDQMLMQVMEAGTGRRSQGWESKVAGKTGSSEASDIDSNLVHAWFAGYFKTDATGYTVAVFMENGQSGRAAALPVFSSIYDYLHSSAPN